MTARVSLKDGQLTWLTEPDLKKVKELSKRRPPSSSNLLEAFTGLQYESDKALLRFARRYGPLGLCEHGFALGHRKQDFTARCHKLSIGVEDTGVVARESLDAWRRYIAIANGVLIVVQDLHRERMAPEGNWQWIFAGIPRERRDVPHKPHAPQRIQLERIAQSIPPGMTAEQRDQLADKLAKMIEVVSEAWSNSTQLWPLRTLRKGDFLAENPVLVGLASSRRETLEDQKCVLANVLNCWLDECETGFQLVWEGPEIEARPGQSQPLAHHRGNAHGGNRLLSSIGVLLLEAVRNNDLYLLCENCHKGYVPKRKPRANEAHYCTRRDCKKQVHRTVQAKSIKKLEKERASK